MKQIVIAIIAIAFIVHSVASADSVGRDPVQPIESAYIEDESVDNDGYKIPLEELLKPGGPVAWLLDVAKGNDAARAQLVGYNTLVAQEAGQECLEDLATIELLGMLLEKYQVNKSEETFSTKQVQVTHTRQIVTSRPAVHGFRALGMHHGNHAKQPNPRLVQVPPIATSNVYKVSDLKNIDNVREQIAKEHGKKIADTMGSVGIYKTAIEESARERQSAVILQGTRLIGGYLKFVVIEKEVYFRVSALPKG